MRAVAQRVLEAAVTVDGTQVGAIAAGLLVYLGVGEGDGPPAAKYVADKIAGLRIFEDDRGRMSRSLADVQGQVLLVSQFTLYGDVRRGRRPSFERAAEPGLAEALYLQCRDDLAAHGIPVETGRFRASMKVSSVVAGPVTILIDSGKVF